MFQIDSSLETQSTYKKFPFREPLRRNYQTTNSNSLNKKDLSFSSSLQKQIKIPLNLSKLYQKKTKNIIVHQSVSVNASTRIQQPIIIMKTINLRTKTNDEDQKLSLRNIQNKRQYNSVDYDSSDSTDFYELRRSYFQKYRQKQLCQIERQPRFRIHSVNDDGIAPWKVDI